MQSRAWLRAQINGVLLGQQELTLKSDPFPLAPHFQNIDSCGLYLHIPFCRQICPYCPYNKELFRAAITERYADAILRRDRPLRRDRRQSADHVVLHRRRYADDHARYRAASDSWTHLPHLQHAMQ